MVGWDEELDVGRKRKEGVDDCNVFGLKNLKE
jgi:hypothetical protein